MLVHQSFLLRINVVLPWRIVSAAIFWNKRASLWAILCIFLIFYMNIYLATVFIPQEYSPRFLHIFITDVFNSVKKSKYPVRINLLVYYIIALQFLICQFVTGSFGYFLKNACINRYFGKVIDDWNITLLHTASDIFLVHTPLRLPLYKYNVVHTPSLLLQILHQLIFSTGETNTWTISVILIFFSHFFFQLHYNISLLSVNYCYVICYKLLIQSQNLSLFNCIIWFCILAI